ncbi:MAG: peptidylprolyl isomerase [Pseudomonadota bacterium]
MKIWKAGALAVAASIVAIIYIAGCGGGAKSGKVLVEINGDKITEGDLEFLGEINPRIQRQLEMPDGKKRIIDNLIEQSLLYQKATKEGLNRDPKVKAKVDLYRRVIIAQSLVEKEMEDAAKKYYDENPDEFKQLGLSMIEVSFSTPEDMKKAKGNKAESMRTEQQALALANELKAKIDKGADFAEVAKEGSDSASTKARGGNLGLVSRKDRRLLALGYEPILEKAFEMKVGEVAGPIKTPNGYEIITVTRGIEVEPYDQAEASILFKVKGDARTNLLDSLKKDAKIAYAEEPQEKKELEGKPAPAIIEKPEAADMPAEKKAEAPKPAAAPEKKAEQTKALVTEEKKTEEAKATATEATAESTTKK